MTEPAGESASRPGAAVTALAVTGMNCNNCARHVAEAIQGVPGVASATVHLESGRATVHWRPDITPDVEPVVAAVRQAGYHAQVLEDRTASGAQAPISLLAGWKFNVFFGAFLTLPLILGEWVLGLGANAGFKWVGFACATPVVLVAGRRFWVGAWHQLQRGRSNMDTLVALGSGTAFGFSTWGLLTGWPGHLYFMEAAAIITLVSLGHWLEALASERAAGSLRALMNLTPPTARLVDAANGEAEVPAATLKVGDRIALRPGDHVPTDGEVLQGASALDESMLTGESRPVEKVPGARVFAGTINVDGRLVVNVLATGETTVLARIIAVVERAQASRADIQRLADRVSSVFVPVVVVVALLTALGWGFAYSRALGIGQGFAAVLWHVHFPETALAAAFIHAAAVLIVACPCAMGLATPAAIMAGTNAAARRGILIRDGQALEKSGTLTTIVFDKTGTLTQGRLSVAAFEELSGRAPPGRTAREIAAALAGPSNHPLSRALAEPVSAAVEGWRELRGRGIESGLADVPGSLFRVGSLTWLAECGVDLAEGNRFAGEWSAKGATVLGVAADAHLLGVVALHDELKPHAVDVVARLQAEGCSVALLTGDQRVTALAIARSVGIPEANVLAEVRPEHKADRIRELQQHGERVAFVGDGLNDAPALEQADLGIAVSRASDVAREAADILLLNSDLQAIPEALGLAQATLRTIRQNLFWAFFYNAAAVPLAALGLLSPVICAAAMGASDLIVIGNALRLLRRRPSP